jgi:Tol biopolymer transport system component
MRLGPYEIQAPIGAGGMGEVYRAQDTRLDRTVAIKVLPEALAGNPQLRERFEREARAVSSLNHPHICVLYDVGHQEGIDFLVMEHLEGETLAARLEKGPLPADQVLRYAIEIAEALDAAHRQGVFHRDLKPGNIFLTRSGAKLLDFGLAKMRPTAAASQETTPTRTLTQEGTVLGTPQYMAPEQLEGTEADARTDIFAFGAVLFEMLTGKRAFEGKTQASVIAAILHIDPPSVATLQSATPPAIERVVRICLEKNPDDRWQTARDLLRELQRIAEPGAAALPAATRRRRTTGIYLAAISVLLAALLALAFIHFREPRPEPQLLRYTLAAPGITPFSTFALSPDGHYLAIGAGGEQGRQLWVRALDSLQAQPLAGTEEALYPFWSPDSRYIGFFAQGKLKRIAANGGPVQTLCDAPQGRGGTWNQEGVILFAPTGTSVLFRVPALGGVPAPVTKPEGPSSHRFPVFLPDGRRFLYLVYQRRELLGRIRLASLDSKEDRSLVADISNPMYLAPVAGSRHGHLLFVRENTLMAQPVDPQSMQTAGDLFPVAEQVSTNVSGYAPCSISENGVLVYQTGSNALDRQHIWFDRGGKELAAIGGPVPSLDFTLSPDAKRVLIVHGDARARSSDLWMHDLEHGTGSRFTFHASINRFPVWSPDGGRIVFASDRNGTYDLYQRASNGTGDDEILFQSATIKYPYDWSRDGRFLIFMSTEPKTKDDLWALPLTGDRKPIPLLQSEFSEWMGQLSPDGRWLAYVSDESGQAEVYVQPFTAGAAPGSGKPVAGKWPISTGGGWQPRWRGDGKELFYLAGRKLMAVEIKTSGGGFDHGPAQALFTLRFDPTSSGRYLYRYAPSADGKRFLVGTEPGESNEAPPLTVVVNWLAGVKK